MPFEIVNETYQCSPNENPKKYGYIKGYTSNTVGETYLRLNCKSVLDDEQIDWYKRVFGEVPTTPNTPSSALRKKGCRPLQAGDIIGEGIRLNKKQVRQLIKELKRWLRRGE